MRYRFDHHIDHHRERKPVPTSRDLIKNVNDQTLDQVRRSQDAVVDAVRALSARAPKLPGAIDVPIDPDRLIDAAFGFAQSALDLNHRFAHKLLALTGVETTAAATPSAAAAEPAEKVTVKRSAVKKAAVTKVAAGEAPAKKAPAKKAPEKAPAKKVAAKKAPAKRARASQE
jgi:hypothetical protein